MSSTREALSYSLRYHVGRILGRLRRILNWEPSSDIQLYNMMTADNQKSSTHYHAGALWHRINTEFNDFIWAGNLSNLRTSYINRWFAGPEPASRQVYRTLLRLYYHYLRSIDDAEYLRTAREPEKGGTTNQEIIEGCAVSLDFLQSVEECYGLRRAWAMADKHETPHIIGELGADYDRLAYVCVQNIPNCIYVIFDHPEALIYAHTWLSSVLPGRVAPYERSRDITSFIRETLQNYRVWTPGAHQIEYLESATIDAFVNIYSFAEMPRTSIENYTNQLARIAAGGVFYTKQRKTERNIFDGEVITQDSYPKPAHWCLLWQNDTTLYEHFFETAYAL